MPRFIDKTTGQEVEFAGQAAIEASQSPQYEPVGGATVPITTPAGRQVEQSLTQPGYLGNQAVSPTDLAAQQAAAIDAAQFEEQYGGVGGDIRAGAEGVLSGISLGGYDVLADWLGMDSEKYAQANPNWRLGGELTGIVGTAALTGGESAAAKVLVKTPAGLVSRGSMALGAKVAGTGVKGAMAGAALEGSAYAAAQTTSQILVDHDPLISEAALAEVARSALFGAVTSGATVGVFSGLGKIGNKLIRQADEAAPVLNVRGRAGREFAEGVGKSMNDLDESVEHAASQVERASGLSGKFSPDEAAHFTKFDANLRQYGDDIAAQTDALAKVNVRAPRGIATFNEYVQGVHEDMTQLLGPAYRATPRGLAFDEAGDKLFKALATNEPAAIAAATPGYIKQLKLTGRALGVDVAQDAARVLEFENAMKAPPEVGLADDVEAARARFAQARERFDAAGGLSPEAVERLVVQSTDAGAVRAIRELSAYAKSARELGDMIGHATPDEVSKFIDDLEPLLVGTRVPREGVDPAVVVSLRETQDAARAALGVPRGEAIDAKHIIGVVDHPPAEVYAKLQTVDKYFKEARAFAAGTKDDLLAARLDRLEGAISEYTHEALQSVNIERLSKEALGHMMGFELLEHSGLSGPADDLLQFAAIHQLLKKAGKQSAVGARGPFAGLAKRMASRAGARGLPAAAKAAGVVPRSGVVGTMAGGALMAAGYSAGGWLLGALASQGKLAGMAAGVRNRFGAALENVGKAGSHVARPGALALSWLHRSRFSFGGQEPAPVQAKGERGGLLSAFKARAAELNQLAADPRAAQAIIHEQLRPLRLVSEQLADTIEVHSVDIPLWLQDKMPKDPGTIQTLGQSRWEPSEVQVLEFAEYGKGALYPAETIEGALHGDISPQAAEAVRTLWPEHFRAFQLEVLKRAPELADKLTYDQQVRLSILTDVPIDSTMRPEFRRFMIEFQAEQAAQAEQSMPGGSGSSTKSNPEAEAEYSPAQQLKR